MVEGRPCPVWNQLSKLGWTTVREKTKERTAATRVVSQRRSKKKRSKLIRWGRK